MQPQPQTGHGYAPRVIRVAGALSERYLNPDVAAYGRQHFANARMWSGKFRNTRPSERRDHFWFLVGRALGSYMPEVRSAIRHAREAYAHASAAAHQFEQNGRHPSHQKQTAKQ